MRTDQLALLAGIVVLAMVALLGPLALPRAAGLRTPEPNPEREGAGQRPDVPLSRRLHEQMVRVVSYLFIGSALVVITIAEPRNQPLVYVVLAVGALLVVLGQDILPMRALGRWRLPVEVGGALGFVTVLVALTGGHDSPFFFGYVLILAGGSLRASGIGPIVLGTATGAAYLVGVSTAAGAPPVDEPALGLIGFNLVSLALIAYVAAMIGRTQRAAEEAALRLSRYDALTGVHSRIYFTTAMQQEILRAVRSARPFSLLMLDLDGLKPVNDRYGHEFGDRLLSSVGEAIRQAIRGTDTAARYGGDEFVVILPETELEGAIRVAEKLRLDIADLALPWDRSVIQTSVSIGVVSYPDDGRTPSELMRRADHAMYEAKRRGRNQIVHYPRPAQRNEHPSRQPAAEPQAPAAVGPGPTPTTAVPPGNPTAPALDRRSAEPRLPPMPERQYRRA